MTREYVASANTVDEAIALACRELGISEDECSPEILQMPKKGLFGKIKQQAKVRVVIETMDSVKELLGVTGTETSSVKTEAASSFAEKLSAAGNPAPTEKTVSAKRADTAKPVPPVEKIAAKPDTQEPLPEKIAAPKKPLISAKTEEPVKVSPEAATEPLQKEDSPAEAKPEKAAAPLTEQEIADVAPKINLARSYLTEIFAKMGIEGITMEFTQTEGRTVIIHLDGAEIGAVIGKRGETLDAIQYLVCLAANRLEGEYVRFTMNAGNYREKREETLKALAQRMARKVLKTGRPAALEPMNPYERRIIHAVITDIDGVFSKSTGEEPNRKVVIKPAARTGGSSGFRGGRTESRPPRGRGGYGAKRQEESAAPAVEAEKPAVEAPKEVKKINDDVKLYSKIEID